MGKALIWGAVAFVAASTVGVLYFKNPSPPCSDQEVTELTIQVLGQQLKIPGKLSLSNIIEKSGGFFGTEHVCEADIQGIDGDFGFLGVKFNRVRYTSSVTQDSHRLYVTAKIANFADN